MPVPVRSPLRWSTRALGLLVLVGGFAACSGEGGALPGLPGAPSGPSEPRPDTLSDPCTEGESRPCTATLGVRDGVMSCYEGTTTCVGGRWGTCRGGDIEDYAAPKWLKPGLRGGPRWQALSPAISCATNPCDAACRQWVEVPEGGLWPNFSGDGAPPPDGGPPPPDAAPPPPDAGPDAGPPPPVTWKQGSYRDYPPGALRDEPCTTAKDCQIGMRCVGPAQGGCSHSQCEEGAGLLDGCNPCVTEVCAANPSCCSQLACAHDPCAVGPALAAGCDPCVSAVCAANPGCCSGAWDATCVAAIATSCSALGQRCECGGGQVADAAGTTCYERRGKASWEGAQRACAAVAPGWNLTGIASSTENLLVRSLLSSNGPAWIGASDRVTEGSWRWIDGSVLSYGNWAGGEPSNGIFGLGVIQEDCVEMRPQSSSGWGTWNDNQCSRSLDYVCEGPPATLSQPGGGAPGAWDAACVTAVHDVCGAFCEPSPVATGPRTDGTCQPWIPEQTDPSCAAYDLAIGPTCLDAGAGIVPLCNHGSAYAPAGITVTRYPAGTFDATPDSPPGAPHHRSAPLAAPIGTCTSTEQIPPGACIEVACAATAGEELLANGPPSDAAECRRDDNWGLFLAGACGAPICSGNASQAVRRKRHLFIAVDRSAQMDSQPPQLLWWAAASAVKRFAADQDSAGMHVALRFFPDPAANPTLPFPPSNYVAPFAGCDAESGASCGGFFGWNCNPTAAACMEASCAMPLVEGDLVAELAPTDRTEANLIAAIDATAPEPASSGGGFLFGGGGSTPNVPLHPMLEGALSWAEAGKLREPDGEWAVVLITSALPQGGCDNDVSHIAALAAAANSAPFGIKTHVIGLQSAGGGGAPINQGAADAIAAAGGTGQAHWISAGDAQASQSVVDALQAIGTDATLCTVELPNPGAFDPAQASVSFIPGVPPGGITPACRYDQVLWNGRCYASEKAGSGSTGGFFGFGGSAKTLTWKMSRDLCRSYGTGWDLAKIDSAAEGNFLRTTFATTVGLGFPAWIGGNSLSNLRDWRWSSDGSAFWSGGSSGSAPVGAYASWASGEPTVSARCGFLGGSTCYQQCVQLRADGTWQDASCSGNGSAVCEGPLLGSVEDCEPGHLQGADGRCYYVDKTARTFDAARASCQANGTGWDLAVPTSASQNAYLAGFALDAANDAWIGVHDPEPNDRWQRVDGTEIWSEPVAGCRAGETQFQDPPGVGPIRCYTRQTFTRGWTDARDGYTYGCGFFQTCAVNGCTDLGAGFDLVSIESRAENSFVQGLAGGQTVWTGGNDRSSDGNWVWAQSGTQYWKDIAGCQ